MCMRVEFHHRKKGFPSFFDVLHEAEGLARDLLVDRLHALLVERPGRLDLLRAVRVGPAVDHAARREALAQLRILEVVRMLGLVLGVEVVERAEELVEAVRGRQMLVAVAEVVLAELAGLVPPGLEQLGDGDVAGLKPFLGARQADLEHAGAKADLTGDEAARPAVQLCWPYQSVNSAPSLAMRSMFGVL